jgi:hypothetical protein
VPLEIVNNRAANAIVQTAIAVIADRARYSFYGHKFNLVIRHMEQEEVDALLRFTVPGDDPALDEWIVNRFLTGGLSKVKRDKRTTITFGRRRLEFGKRSFDKVIPVLPPPPSGSPVRIGRICYRLAFAGRGKFIKSTVYVATPGDAAYATRKSSAAAEGADEEEEERAEEYPEEPAITSHLDVYVELP